ncbi:hypothetical protein [Eisenbergiella porci]|uniref:hypothetical protein n=1 Tax=Eisenbergiella porci TaxID=2652274 RepID=UPI002A83DE8D|nr:hypothetical protein [Eisenbergiella porci]
MKKKKIILITSGLCYLILAVFTVVSNVVYQNTVPEVCSIVYEGSFSFEEDRLTYFVPEETITGNDIGRYLFKIQKRPGRFREEYYVKAVPIEIWRGEGEAEVRNEKGYIRIQVIGLEHLDNIVIKSSAALSDGQAIKWLNPEDDKKLNA